MASIKLVRFDLVADVTHFGIEECVEDSGTYERRGVFQGYEAVDWPPPREISDFSVSDVVAAVNRAKKLRACVEQDLERSARSSEPRSLSSELAEHAPGAHKSASLIGQFWRRFGTPSKLGTCRTPDEDTQSKSAHGKRRWGCIELSPFKHRFMNNNAKEDAWTQSLFGVGPSDSQVSAVTDAWGPASVPASGAPCPSPHSSRKKMFSFWPRVGPEVQP
eukprot:TRINITY_DN14443_c0_g4_i1.p1 TRINITY_DN14443_c0_g4~~TRINITY_DN14443_c0_g4_i1.p1  ORF type:complete len:219 (+),score=28.08 TRINITY_DN14443_c0_g4_i1:96-752(+)